MEFNSDIHDKIDSYILGELNGEELLAFENEIASNQELAEEVNSQKELIDIINEHYQKIELKNKLDKFHSELNIKKLKPKREKRYLRSVFTISIAASIALLVSFSFMYFSSWFEYGKHVNTYTKLNNKLNDLSTTQKSIWEILITSDNEKKVKPAYPSGTSFVISSNGYLATNYHVVRNVDSIIIVNQLDSLVKFKAKLVYKDINFDLAILQVIDTNFKSFKTTPYIFNKNYADLGEYVYTLGYSKEKIVFGEGSVSSSTGYKEDTIAYQISIPVNPGNSGGPLIDVNGNILGVISGKHSDKSGATFAIKSKYLLMLIDSISNDSAFSYPILSQYNKIKWLKRKGQIKKLKPFVYKVEVYK